MQVNAVGARGRKAAAWNSLNASPCACGARGLMRTKLLLYIQKLQENKTQTNKANLQTRSGVQTKAAIHSLTSGFRVLPQA